ncbi:hypothetical protein SAMN06266787_106162 [Halorubrum ezzemoulense]|uniref:DUF8048 domain-containing protein n=1 Tax=Halorubrum ezzemoulense TaxID=337243 RepID=A0A238XVG0_HALEZ|nr:hypothetical protein EXE52_17505 [Halorubrum sp. CGM4_25_10-8A]SNR62413.1 hypothetical protein SAMN06266787_106162 [Halorubrum ezzemoulense]
MSDDDSESGDHGEDADGRKGNADGEVDGRGADADRDPGTYPIEGTALVKTTALASVPAARVPTLLARVQSDLCPRIDAYRRRYEQIEAEPGRETFLVEPDHWDEVAERVGLSERERDAVVRAHEAAVERLGAGSGRRAEFDAALEIRSAVVIGLDEDGDGGREEDAGREADGSREEDTGREADGSREADSDD